MTAEENKHRERLKILEDQIGEDFNEMGNIHVGISDAMESYHKESSKELVKAFLEVFDKASCIQHWHDTLYNKEVNECEGMVVSAKKVRELWVVLEKHRELRHSKALENHLKTTNPHQ